VELFLSVLGKKYCPSHQLKKKNKNIVHPVNLKKKTKGLCTGYFLMSQALGLN
jgi:hypothetical protein